jgi:TetR/AcrR family transcriptional repressor of nem operon
MKGSRGAACLLPAGGLDISKTTGQFIVMAQPSHREQLVAAGTEMLRVKGFNGCSVEDITRAANVPKGSFYNHFESKDGLGKVALDRYWTRINRLQELLEDRTLSPTDRLRGYFAALCDGFSQRQFHGGCLIGNFSLELSEQSASIRERLREIFTDWTRAIESCLKDAQVVGQLRPDVDVRELAEFLINAFEGAVLRAKVEKTGTALDCFMKLTFSKILA